jgi:pyridoxamine 5'-phosphate oxidase
MNKTGRELREADTGANPFVLFREWYEEAGAAGLPEPDAMTLATADAAGVPSARMVLLRGYDDSGFFFFTNYESCKAGELAVNPRAALVLYWPELNRQIRIQGRVERLSEAESDAYFQTRARGSQLGAWASPQSRPLAGREILDQRMDEATARFPAEVPRPPFWGGFRVVPDVIEFWQGRENRLHDRLEYRRAPNGWDRRRLAP